jgi:transcriptional regulator with XRE-family HTH domain
MPKKNTDKNTETGNRGRKQQESDATEKRGHKEERKGSKASRQAASSASASARHEPEAQQPPPTPTARDLEETATTPADEEVAEEPTYSTSPEYPRLPYGNALGQLIEGYFADPASPCRSYSDLERRSGVSREALSRYVTTRADRRRSPTIDTLVAIADALHLSLEEVCRAAAATAKGVVLPPAEVQHSREAVLSSLAQMLSDAQFSAVVELLRQMHPAGGRTEH